MLLALVSEYEILDLATGTLYEHGAVSNTVTVWLRGEEKFVAKLEVEYAEALWAYLKANLTVKPKE